jgi:phage terminase large subunit-like protein
MHGVCYEQRNFAIKVLERTVIAEHFFAIIFTIDRAEDYDDGRKVGDDPFDPTNWIKANPLMAVSKPAPRGGGQYAIEAKASPSQEGEFKTKHLNMWLGAASAWLNVTSGRRGRTGSSGFATSAGSTAISAPTSPTRTTSPRSCSPRSTAGRLLVKTWFFLPEAALTRDSQSEKETVTLYKQWHEGRWLWTTRGDFVDHGRVERLVRRLKNALNVRRLTGDQFAGFQIMAAKLNEDFDDGTEPSPISSRRTPAT